MKTIILSLFMVFSYQLYAQTNGVFVSDFKLNNRAEKWCWAISQDNNKNMLIGVTNGIVVFDGQNQHVVKLPFTPIDILADPANHRFFVCGYEHVGVLNQKAYANYEYTNLLTSDETDYTKLIAFNDTLNVCAQSLLMRFALPSLEKIDSIATDDLIIEQTFQVNKKLYFIIDYFPYIIQNGAFKEVLDVEFPVDEYAYSVPISDDQVLLGTLGNTYYYFNGKNFKTKTIQKNAFFDNNLIVNAEKFNDSTIVLSSLAGGIALFDINKQKIVNQLSYFNGLPDDEIRTFFIDSDGAIWVSHEFGISRIDFEIGIESFSFYPGLKGTPIAVTEFDKSVYVATSDGLFALSEVKDYNEFEVSVSVPVNVVVEVPVSSPVKESDTDNIEIDAEQKDNSKSLFSFLSKKKRKTEDIATEPDELHEDASLEPKKRKKEITKTERRTVKKRSLKSVSHYFTLVDGVNDKCTQLVPFERGLLVAGNNGLYVVENKKGKKIISNVYVYNIYYASCCPEAYIATSNGLYKVFRQGNNWEVNHFAETTSLRIHALVNELENIWVLGFDNMIMRARLVGKNIEVINQTDLVEAAGRSFFIKRFNQITEVIGANTIYEFTPDGALKLKEEIAMENIFLGNQASYLWEFNSGMWQVHADNDTPQLSEQSNKVQLFQNIRYINVALNNDLWIITENNNFYRLLARPLRENLKSFDFIISKVHVNGIAHAFDKNLELSPSQNNVEIFLSAPFYFLQNGVQFRYKIEGLYNEYSNWTNQPKIELNYLPAGSFNLKIEAKNGFGKIKMAEVLKLKIAKPFTQTFAFVLLLSVLVGTLIYLVLRIRMKKLEHDKVILEQKVKERTFTIEEQKEKIEKQHDEITQSIRYAKRIQTAMLPHDEIIEAMIPEHFILFKPRDIVSGDFYFFKPLGKKVVLIAADCTGHGVPGGFMSMLGISYLMEITSQVPYPTAAEILNLLREKIKLTLGQTGAESAQKDGMDMSVSLIDIDNKVLEFAGAFNSLYFIRNNELETVKADRQPVAVYFKEDDFTNHTIEIQEGDVFYMFSDGYQDQIGGPNQRKFMTKNFKNLLMDIYTKPMPDQKVILDDTIEAWRGSSMQVDDILVIGFQI
jgi:serine phosphatase RsbU (regulator of sigma subunit)